MYVDGGQGDVYYAREMGDSLVLIAGGIGITPLVSIVRTVRDSHPDVKTTLIYSTRSPTELVFREELKAITQEHYNISCFFTVTGPDAEDWTGRRGRIDRELLLEAGAKKGDLFFLSGPAPMAEAMKEILRGLGVSEDSLRYEQWW